MHITFVCSGNRGISPIIEAQARSLQNLGHRVDLYPIIGKGFWGYVKHIPKLRQKIKQTKPDIIHAHYSLCGIIAVCSSKTRVVTSLMGSDINQSFLVHIIIMIFSGFGWSTTIVKSKRMSLKLCLKNVHIIPNGVDTAVFFPMDRDKCQAELGWDKNNRHVLFVSSSFQIRQEKNLQLALDAITECRLTNLRLHIITHVEPGVMPVYLNACDLVLLTSKWEGSPNIVKEAMACDVPVVTTDVGDVRWLLDSIEGCFITSSDAIEIANAILECLKQTNRVNTRQRIVELGLDSKTVALKLQDIYSGLISA